MPERLQNPCLNTHIAQKFSRCALLRASDIGRRALCDDSTAASTTLGANVDDVVGNLYNIEVMFDDNGCIASVNQLIYHAQQLANILEVKARCRLVEDVERATSFGL